MKIGELLSKQKELDAFIAAEKGLGNPYKPEFFRPRMVALLVEIGEFANATRCFKYWSNKGPEPKERILDELADILHFTLSLMNFSEQDAGIRNDSIVNTLQVIGYKYFYMKNMDLEELILNYYEDVCSREFNKLIFDLCCILYKLNYSALEMEMAYMKKNNENYVRQEVGY